MLSAGQDSALLRFALGSAYLQQSEADRAAVHLNKAVTLNPDYSAAWKLLGKAHTKQNNPDEARLAYQNGIAVAEKNGDMQAAREMRVFLKRLGDKPDHQPR